MLPIDEAVKLTDMDELGREEWERLFISTNPMWNVSPTEVMSEVRRLGERRKELLKGVRWF